MIIKPFEHELLQRYSSIYQLAELHSVDLLIPKAHFFALVSVHLSQVLGETLVFG